MTITNPDVARLIEEQLNSGRYTSADEVILAALKLLRERENGGHRNGTSDASEDDANKRDASKLSQNLAGSAPNERINDMNVFLEMVSEISKTVPDSEWEKFPADFSQNIDHYLYGTPKRY